MIPETIGEIFANKKTSRPNLGVGYQAFSLRFYAVSLATKETKHIMHSKKSSNTNNEIVLALSNFIYFLTP